MFIICLFVLNVLLVYGLPVGEPEDVEFMSVADLQAKHEAMQRPDLYGGDMLGEEASITNTVYGNPWKRGVVVYEIDSSLRSHRSKIQKAITEFEQKTCLRFQERTSQSSYLLIQDGDGCNSYVGEIGWSAQPVNLQINGCLSHSTIVHELGHAIGLLHTHQRNDRDDFINVYLENVSKNYRSAFDKEDAGRIVVPYDTSSVMHYDSYAASTNGKPTMKTKNGGIIRDRGDSMPGLSENDVRAIRTFYKCK